MRHFARRFSERIGFQLTDALYQRIIALIQGGKAVHLYDQSLRVKIKGVHVDGVDIVVAYDKLRGTLVTVLPKDSVFYKDLAKAP